MNELKTIEAGTLAILNKSEIDQQIATARQFPRDVAKAQKRVLELATMSEAGAAECLYALTRTEADGKQKVIEGPSIRFAEILTATWGNCRAGARVTEESHEFITAQGIFHDLESNAVTTQEVRRRITGRNGRRYSVDMIGVTANAACSIAIRNAILRGIPKALWSEIYDSTRKFSAGGQTTIGNRRAQAVKAFAVYGVDEARLLARLEVATMDEVDAGHIATLSGLYNAIKEGEMTPEAAFPPLENEKPAAAKGAAPKTMDEFAGEQVDKETGEVTTAADVPAHIEAANDGERNPTAPKKEPAKKSEESVSDLSKASAYQRGTEARNAGMLLRAVPPEYRSENRQDEVTEWKRGWMDADYKAKETTT